MARPKKTQDDAGVPLMSTTDMLWMRDNVVTGLSNLEQGVHELRRTYITYFNSRLPDGHPARLNVPFLQAPFLMDNGIPRPRAETPAIPGAEIGGKRKRKPHDPNAPKRALTSYFLFMQDHKPQIKEANPDWTAAQISAESEKRWENITDEEKNDYEVRYQVDLCRYYEQKKAYEAGEPIPDISAAEARKLYEDQIKSGQPPKGRKIGKAPTPAAPAPVQEAAESEDSSDDEEETPEPQKAVTPPKTDRSSKRQKTAKDNAASSKTTAAKGKASPDSPKADRVPTSPELERKKKPASKKKESKVDDEAEEEAEVAVASPVKSKAADKKDKKTKRKRKSEANVDED